MPCSAALRAAFSAAICAANGVDLREPLKPTWPAEAQLITAPEGSVMETMVLLNVLLMCAWPWETFFFSLRRGLRTAVRVLGGMSVLSRVVIDRRSPAAAGEGADRPGASGLRGRAWLRRPA